MKNGTPRNVLGQCKKHNIKKIPEIFSFRALKAKEGKGVDCEAAEAEFSSCHKAAKERYFKYCYILKVNFHFPQGLKY